MTHAQKMHEQISQLERPEAEPQIYFCGAETHLAKMTPACALVHPFALRISYGSRVFSGSATSVANHLGRNESTIRRAYRELEESGWFEKRVQGTFNPSVYRVLSHEEWAARYPNQCLVKLEYHWSHENDPLGQQLWVASGTRVKPLEFQIKNLRGLGISDDAVVLEFEDYYQRVGQHKQAKNVIPGFFFELREKLKPASIAV